MTTAKVENRYATNYFDVRFYGKRADEMKQEWDSIYDKYQSKYIRNWEEAANLNASADSIVKDIKTKRHPLRFWHTKEEIKEIRRAKNLRKDAIRLEGRNERLRLFELNSTSWKIRIEKFLQDNGFALTSFTHHENGGTGIWICED